MRVQFYLLPILLFMGVQMRAQDCSNLSLTYTTSESRCVATGGITVQVNGGSGSYNYKAIGPVTTPVTSSNILTGLPTGYYSIEVKDLVSGCILTVDSAFVPGSYSDPRFQLTKTDAGCSGNDGEVTVMNQAFGRAPFQYSIIAPSPFGVGTTNTSGVFPGLIPGEYSIRLQDSCGGIQVRKITIENYNWWFDSTSVQRLGCDSAHVYIKLKDNKGNVNTSGTTFNGFTYGVVLNPGDTTWKTEFDFNTYLGTKRTLTLVVKDNCGLLHTLIWNLPNGLKPALNSVTKNNLTCLDFTASVAAQNITNPLYCLFNDADVLITCNATGVFNNLSYGSYCIKVTDPCYDTTITRCFTQTQSLPSVATTVAISNKNCLGFTASITGKTNLTNPLFCLYGAGHVLMSCNSSGVFDNIPYGPYCIEVDDNCVDTLIQRCFTVLKPLPVLTGYTISGSTCSSFNVVINGDNLINPIFCLYDSLGNVITCDSSGNFNNLNHGYYCVRAISCGDTTTSICFNTTRPIPSLGLGIQILAKNCATFDFSMWGQTNLTNPQYCLYNQVDTLISCNSTGIFQDIPYGSYCVRVKNTCYDTTILRCFTQLQELPSVNAALQVTASTCSTVSFRANGTNLKTPTYCLYNEADSLLFCNSTGIFNNQPYGKYCVVVKDGCVDTTFKVCQAFDPVRGISLTTAKSCTIGNTFIDVQFTTGNAPYTIQVYHPNSSLIFSTTTSVNPYRVELTPIPVSIQYKVVGTDNCGNRDSAYIIPDANVVNKTISIRSKCPSAAWLNGAGDILANCSSNYYPVSPQIIKKNGAAFVRSYSSVSGTEYSFSDLEPAQYIIEYTQTNCNSKLYDTVTISPYDYPSQGQSAIYQCDNNSFSLGADVQGGVSPYSYQIIGSLPEQPSIATVPQSSPVFDINTGTVYSLVRLRSIDACGNATLNDVSVLPLQNLSITASNSCFFQNITLTVDSIPNASYLWYHKTSPTDSVLIGSGLDYNLPFFLPEQIGEYVCKMIVNNGCVTRVSRFTLDGDCGDVILAAQVELKGRKTGSQHQLYWKNASETGIVKYIIERRIKGQNSYHEIGQVAINTESYYEWNDQSPAPGINYYRLKMVYPAKFEYSNMIQLKSAAHLVSIYPNPVKQELHISFSSQTVSSFRIEIINASGQAILRNDVKNISTTTLTYPRNGNIQPGIYLVRITDLETGAVEIHKLLYE